MMTLDNNPSEISLPVLVGFMVISMRKKMNPSGWRASTIMVEEVAFQKRKKKWKLKACEPLIIKRAIN